MDFSLSEEQRAIEDQVGRICARFGDEYWLDHDSSGAFPSEFKQAMADGGWLGIAMPVEQGGAGLGVTEACLMMHVVARAGGMSAASAIHINIFGPHPIVVHGTPEQRERWLAPLIQGKSQACFGVTEPNTGLNTGSLTTKAERSGNGYVISGRKMWTTTAQGADKIMLLARTTPADECKRPIDGLTLFYTDVNRDFIEIREIEKMGRKAVDTNSLFIDGLPVPADDRVGEEGRGFYHLLDGLNPERILIGGEAVGMGRQALARATQYAKDREVFGRPIGQNQAIQHPLAESWMELEAAWYSTMYAAWLYDQGESCGAQANAAKYLGAEAGYRACERSVMAHGGMGYAKEFHVERLLRESFIPRIAPISPELIKCFIAERVLGLPRSY